jgi:hypothetical protein
MFSGIVPPIPISRNLKIYVPEWYSINFGNRYHPYVINAYFSWYPEKYRDWRINYFWNCNNEKIWYSGEEKKFICTISDEELKTAQKKYLESYVLKNFNAISPILHKSEYKRNYWNDIRWLNSDWIFDEKYYENIYAIAEIIKKISREKEKPFIVENTRISELEENIYYSE